MSPAVVTVKPHASVTREESDMNQGPPRNAPAAIAAAVLLAAATLLPRVATAAEALPKLGADLAQSSVSGLSSGAYMAGQIQVAHSKDIVGAGIVAGGPYACAESAAARLFPFWPSRLTRRGTGRARASRRVRTAPRSRCRHRRVGLRARAVTPAAVRRSAG